MAKVNRLWNYLMPFATDSTGVCSLFCDADAVVIGMDPGATAVRCYPFTEQRSDKKARYKGMQIGELDMVMGKMEESLDRLHRLTDEEPAEQIVLVGTPVASMVGIDLKALARRFEKESGRTVMGFPTTGNQYYDEGLSGAFRVIYERLRREEPETFSVESIKPDKAGTELPYSQGEEVVEQEKTISLLGWNTLDYPDEAMRKALMEHLEQHQMRIGSIWGMNTSTENWRHFPASDLDVVCSASGFRVAETIRKDFGIPYVTLDELLEGTGGLKLLCGSLLIPEGCRRILIAGEQIGSNALRKRIRELYAARGSKPPEIINAGFFLMHPKLMEDRDVRLRSEEELAQLLTGGAFDLLIGDPMLRLIADPSMSYIARIHPPVSGSFADQFSRYK